MKKLKEELDRRSECWIIHIPRERYVFWLTCFLLWCPTVNVCPLRGLRCEQFCVEHNKSRKIEQISQILKIKNESVSNITKDLFRIPEKIRNKTQKDVLLNSR